MSVKSKLIYVGIALFMALSMSSCASSVADKLTIESFDNLDIKGLSGANVELGINNDSGYKVKVNECRITLKKGAKRIVSATLVEGVEIDRRAFSQVPTTWRFSNVNPLAALQLSAELLGAKDESELLVDIEGRAKVSLINHRFSQRNVPLKNLLNGIR